MTRPRELPQPIKDARWDPNNKLLSLQTSEFIGPHVKTVTVNLKSGGNIVFQGDDDLPSSLTQQIQMPAITERRARKKLARRLERINITNNRNSLSVSERIHPSVARIPFINTARALKSLVTANFAAKPDKYHTVTVTVPREHVAAYKAKTIHGDVAANNIHGEVEVESAGSNVHMKDVDGSIAVFAGFGTVTAENITFQGMQNQIEATGPVDVSFLNPNITFDARVESGSFKTEGVATQERHDLFNMERTLEGVVTGPGEKAHVDISGVRKVSIVKK